MAFVKLITAILACSVCKICFAVEYYVVVDELKTGEKYSYEIKVEPWSVVRVRLAEGRAIASVSEFSIFNEKLLYEGRELADADEVIFQCATFDGYLVVVRDEYNSFSSPLRIFSALTGHPVQVSEIRLLYVFDGRVIRNELLVEMASSYEWLARIVQK